MNTSKLWILAGGNGAGKSTFYNLYLAKHGIKFVNADLIAKEISSEGAEDVSYQAATIAAKIREDLIAKGVSFCFETVFSHESKIDFIAQAKAHGYKVILIYIHLTTPALNEARVQQRVAEGGHSVPPDKIHSRIPRTMKHIRTALTLVDEAWLLNNSLRDDPFRQTVVYKSGEFKELVSPLPEWVKVILPES
ncbi:zeta toxin family protein [Desulfopila inferna]|uniref:zeta toxin family protein n=1 Tax=Desulfopila inferna TaxID=468528 RepID=UPI0019641625|nr:zeta toxin family protein [Desulfopila inferna]MBM9605771.1 dephospho-CoA kinase [Desulfopila inferna]